MPVATFRRPLDTSIGPKEFPAPKRAAELKYWYKAVRKVIPQLPEWQERFHTQADLEVETIIVHFQDGGVLFIARKRRLR